MKVYLMYDKRKDKVFIFEGEEYELNSIKYAEVMLDEDRDELVFDSENEALRYVGIKIKPEYMSKELLSLWMNLNTKTRETYEHVFR